MAEAKRVLVCDDDPLLVDLIEYRLRGKGFEVIVARDGDEALARIAVSKLEAVVLDAMMPVVDGYEVLRRIREEEATQSLPVIMLTARKQEKDILSALELGADDYMVKPFIPEELIARLSRLVGGAR